MSNCQTSARLMMDSAFDPDRDQRLGQVQAVDGEDFFPDVEDFLPSPPKPPGALARIPDTAGLRPALTLFILFWAVSLHDWRADRASGLWVSHAKIFQDREYWRLLSALFDHADIGHLLANAPLFLIFGWFLYAFFGWMVFPGAALLIGVLSNLATLYFYPEQAQLLGASGMVYGMVSLWLVLYVRFETSYSWSERSMRALGVSLLLLFPTSFVPQTSYLAHFTGFVLGLGLGMALRGPGIVKR